MGEKQIATKPENSSLETILDDEIFGKKETGFLKRIKQGIEKTIACHRNEVIIPLSLAAGGAIGFITKQTIAANVFLLDKIGKGYAAHQLAEKTSSDHLMLGALCAGATYLILDYTVKKHIGKKIITADMFDKKPKKEKNNFILKNKLALSLATAIPWLLITAKKTYMEPLHPHLKQILVDNYDKVFFSTVPFAIGLIGSLYFLYDQIGKFIGLYNKNTWKNVGIYTIYKVSKKDGLRMFEEESKKGNFSATELLSRVKEDLDEKLDLRKKVIEMQEEYKVYYGKEYSWVKPYSIGSNYYLFKRKKDINVIIDMVMKLYDVNPQEAIKILDKLANVRELDIKSRVLTAKTYFLNNREHDKKENWQELRSQLEKEGRLELIDGSEGKSSRHFDDFTNKNFIFKDYTEDKSNKFFIEREILKILKGENIKVENPLFYYDEENIHKQIFIRDGEKNLREFLEGKPAHERQDYFEKLLPIMMLYQEKVFSALEKQDSGFVMNTEFRGEKRRITIPVLDLEKNLRQKAFYGRTPEEVRLGGNSYIKDLISKIQEFRQDKFSSPMLTLNHGDLLTPNITDELYIIDPRPTVAHPLYDFTYFAVDPVFLPISFDSRKENVLEKMLKADYAKGKEPEFVSAFDYFYFHNAICLAGSRLGHGKPTETEAILSELVEFSKDKGFQNELISYLRNSNAKGLLKNA